MLSELEGVTIGHWNDEHARTGVTVVLFPEGTVASGEVRGGAPGTREWELLAPERMMQRIDAVVLAGGSAFGLAACDGVVRWLEEHGRGFRTSAGLVPIVVGAVIYDLAVGSATRRPGPDEGYQACTTASRTPLPSRTAGAGCGATTGKWRGHDKASPGGIGEDAQRHGDLVVAAMVVANCYGDVLQEGEAPRSLPSGSFDTTIGHGGLRGENTTIGVVATNARLSKLECLLVAQSAHDGVARTVEPAHTLFDGDAFVAASTGSLEAEVDLVRMLAARAVTHGLRKAVYA